jgi:hypothetical protein
MTMPKAYEPIQGQRYQILVKCPGEREYEHLDYAKDKAERDHLVKEYSLVFGRDYYFNVRVFPRKYWKEVTV